MSLRCNLQYTQYFCWASTRQVAADMLTNIRHAWPVQLHSLRQHYWQLNFVLNDICTFGKHLHILTHIQSLDSSRFATRNQLPRFAWDTAHSIIMHFNSIQFSSIQLDSLSISSSIATSSRAFEIVTLIKSTRVCMQQVPMSGGLDWARLGSLLALMLCSLRWKRRQRSLCVACCSTQLNSTQLKLTILVFNCRRSVWHVLSWLDLPNRCLVLHATFIVLLIINIIQFHLLLLLCSLFALLLSQ